MTPPKRSDPDVTKGAVEGNHPEEPHHGNRNAPALDSEGMPANQVAIAEDRIGANVDDAEVSQAGETGQTSDAPRDEERPIEEGSPRRPPGRTSG